MKIVLTWDRYDQLVRKMTESLKLHQFDQIVAISRSGLILGVHLSHILGIRKFGCVEVKRTNSDVENAKKHIPELTYWANIDNSAGKRILLLDDIVGEGKTLRLVKQRCEELGAKVTTGVLVVNLDNFKDNDLNELVDYSGELVRGWVEFPWCS